MLKHRYGHPLTLLVVATHTGIHLSQFLESCRRVKLHPVLLGWGEPWYGFSMKLHLVERYLREHHDPHVMVLDAFDSVVLGGATELLDRYFSFDHPMVMSTQMGCWPDEEKLPLYPPAPTPFATVNAGAWVGDRDYILQLFRQHPLQPGTWDDQRYWTDIFLGEAGLICLDYHQHLFASCGDGFLQWQGGVLNAVTDSRPLVCHGNGGLSLEKLYHWLGLEWFGVPPEA